jgi:hypothetical protein
VSIAIAAEAARRSTRAERSASVWIQRIALVVSE